MPFSNNRGEGYEQKIAQVIADELGTNVVYYYRPGIERGLTRQTLNSDNCDLMLDLPGDAEGVLSTSPLYRSTFVLASRTDRNLDFKNLDDRGSRRSRSASTRPRRSARHWMNTTCAQHRDSLPEP